MKILSVDHAQITIPIGADVEAREFYCQFLGLPEMPKPENLRGRGDFWLNAGNLPVHVGCQDGVERFKSKSHIAYRVDDLAGWRARLAGRGIEILEGAPIPGFERFEFRDPFGNRVEFLQAV